MQTVHKDEDERGGSRRVDSMGVVVCIDKINRCVEGECFRRSGGRNTRI